MVYPLSSGMQQQLPINSSTLQPGITESLKKPEEDTSAEATRPSGTEAAQSQRSEARNNGRTDESFLDAAARQAQDNGGVRERNERGTQLDITV